MVNKATMRDEKNEKRLPQTCPGCEDRLRIDRLHCPACGTTLEGDFGVPRLARLSREDQFFAELFIASSGSLKTVASRMKISYPTVRRKLDELIGLLGEEVRRDDERRRRIIEEAESGKKSAAQAREELEKI